jgi:tetratricopeptide (TPR) repeat protein
MLYQIIPPILIILSVIGIIIFLVKKNPEINRLEKAEQLKEARESRMLNDSANNFSQKKSVKSELAAKIKQGLLVFLEKLVKRFRIIFLKVENSLKNLGEGIRQKRSSKIDESIGHGENEKNPSTEEPATAKEAEVLDGIMLKNKQADSERKNIRERLGLKQKAKQEEVEEKFFRPFVSDHVVVPRRRRETKSRLEELLIERIAANPKDIEAYERLGEYYLEVKNLEHSKECFKQVLRLNPANHNARYKIRKLEKILGS